MTDLPFFQAQTYLQSIQHGTVPKGIQQQIWYRATECSFADGDTLTITCPQDCQGQWVEKPATACNSETGAPIVTHEYIMSAPAVAGLKEDGTTRIPAQPCRDETGALVAAGATKLKQCPRDCRGRFELLTITTIKHLVGLDYCAQFPVKEGQVVHSHQYRAILARNGGTPCPHTPGSYRDKTCPVDCVQTWIPEANARCERNDGQDVVTERLVVQAHPKPGSDGAPGAACRETIPDERAERCPTDCIGEWRRTAEACEDPGAMNWIAQIVSHRYAITRPAEPGYPNNNTPGEKCKDPDCANPVDCQENEGKMESCPRDCRGTWDYATDALYGNVRIEIVIVEIVCDA